MVQTAFIDLEASGLNAQSWPLEVGWCFLDGDADSVLIKPADSWPMSAWDEGAEELHGITHACATKEGETIGKVCATLNAALGDAAVYSDAPDWDGYWLYRLFSTAGIRQRFKILNFEEILAPASPEAIKTAIGKAEATFPHCHRAAPDVLHMRAVYAHLGL